MALGFASEMLFWRQGPLHYVAVNYLEAKLLVILKKVYLDGKESFLDSNFEMCI